MSKLLITKPNIIDGAKKKELKKAGYIVLEADNPKDITVHDEFGDLDRDTLLSCALNALDYGNDPTCRRAFGDLLRKNLIDRKESKTPEGV